MILLSVSSPSSQKTSEVGPNTDLMHRLGASSLLSFLSFFFSPPSSFPSLWVLISPFEMEANSLQGAL